MFERLDRTLRFKHRIVGVGLVAALAGCVALADAAEIVRFENLDDEQVDAQAFRLTRSLRVHIVCEGAGDGGEDEMYAYGWILNSATRDVVWALTPDGAQSERGRNYVFDGDVTLPAGNPVLPSSLDVHVQPGEFASGTQTFTPAAGPDLTVTVQTFPLSRHGTQTVSIAAPSRLQRTNGTPRGVSPTLPGSMLGT